MSPFSRTRHRLVGWWGDVEVDAYHLANHLGWPQGDWRYALPIALSIRFVQRTRYWLMKPIC